MHRTGLESGFNFIEVMLRKIGIVHLKMIIFEGVIELEVPTIETKIPIEILLASKDDIEKLYKKKRDAVRRFEDGDLCFIAKHKNEPIAHFWVSTKKTVHIPELARSFSFGDHAGYIYDGWVHSKFRNYKIAKKAMEEILRFLKSKNIAKAYLCTRVLPVKKILSAFNFYPKKEIAYLRIFMFKNYKETDLGDGFA